MHVEGYIAEDGVEVLRPRGRSIIHFVIQEPFDPLAVLVDPAAAMPPFVKCETPFFESVCRCGHYRLEWPLLDYVGERL